MSQRPPASKAGALTGLSYTLSPSGKSRIAVDNVPVIHPDDFSAYTSGFARFLRAVTPPIFFDIWAVA